MKTEIIYYTDGRLPARIYNVCMDAFADAGPRDMAVCCMAQHKDHPRSLFQMVVNLLAAVSMTDADYLWLAEHDVLYPPGYFFDIPGEPPWDFLTTRPGYYLTEAGYSPRPSSPMSSFCCKREPFIRHLTGLIHEHCVRGKYKQTEPRVNDYLIHRRLHSKPWIDIRHGGNATGDRRVTETVEEIEYWPSAKELWTTLTGERT